MYHHKAIAVLAAIFFCSAVYPATTSQKKKAATTIKPNAVQARKPVAKTPVRRSTSTRTSKSVHASHTAQKAPPRSTFHPGQSSPTPERYKEIQTALAQKGYLHGEPSGQWGQDSAEALRRFQQDQNLQASGKLDSLSIIALGLGPKR